MEPDDFTVDQEGVEVAYLQELELTSFKIPLSNKNYMINLLDGFHNCKKIIANKYCEKNCGKEAPWY